MGFYQLQLFSLRSCVHVKGKLVHSPLIAEVHGHHIGIIPVQQSQMDAVTFPDDLLQLRKLRNLPVFSSHKAAPFLQFGEAPNYK